MKINRNTIILLGIRLFFLGLLVTPLIIRHFSTAGKRPSASDPREFAFRQFGFYLRDVAEEAGIHFVHQSPRLDPKLNHILPQIASMGASVSVVDYDRDGWNDLYFTSSRYGARNALYRNLGDGTFRDVAGEVGLADVNRPGTGVSMGAVWGDYDNDGYEDLFLYKWGRPELFHNDGGTGFTRVTEAAGFPAWVNANTAIWLDYNSDGNLDLFLGGYYPARFDLWHLKTTRIMPESFEYARNGGRNYLFENQGDGTFRDVTEQAGLSGTRWTLAAGAADLRGTGYPDLFVANDYGVDEYYLNEKGQHFLEAGAETNIGFAPKSGMNVSFGDVSNRGTFGIYVTNITENGVLMQGNNFWVPDDGNAHLRFANLAGQMGISLGGWSYGAQFGDLNNDGATDLYVANGFISARKGTSYWYDYSKVTGGNTAIISDANNWPDMRGRSQSGYQQNRIWLNDGTGRFQEVADLVGGTQRLDSRSVAMVDLRNRGVLDIVVANQNNRPLVYKNQVVSENHWIDFNLEGTRSNRSAIGAIVTVKWAGGVHSQVVSGGIGYCSQNQRRLHFGLGTASQVDQAVIRWPSGSVQTLDHPDPDTIHSVTESP